MPSYDPHCVFCRIISGELPCAKVYEDDKILAFLDLAPARAGHTLLAPRLHAATLLDMAPGQGEALVQGMRAIGRVLRSELGAEGFNCIQNNFPAAGQVVMHLHWHIIPRFTGDNLGLAWKPGRYPNRDEMAALAQRMSARIAF